MKSRAPNSATSERFPATNDRRRGASEARRFRIRAAAAWWIGLQTAIGVELLRPEFDLSDWWTIQTWARDPLPDSTLLLPLLLLAPICVIRPGPVAARRRRLILVRVRALLKRLDALPPVARCLTAAGLGILAIIMSLRTASFAVGVDEHRQSFSSLVPAIHDELSYQLQSEMMASGRWWRPGPTAARELFHQMHVMNEGRFASRYFPGTGGWICPFLVVGHPIWGHWFAGALIGAMVFLIGCRLDGVWTGLIAGLLTAVSPGMAVFSNLLLSHHPTLVGVCGFLLAFIELMHRPRWPLALLSGCGLAMAVLCRPMTAAAVALPFSVWYLVQAQRARRGESDRPFGTWVLHGVVFLVPVMAGFIVIGAQNRAITGDILKTPYALYTDRYTPRHVYGFNNGVRGDAHRSPQVLTTYDNWARNLTPSLAASNVLRRLRASLSWTLGLVPLTIAGTLFLLTWRDYETPWKLIYAAIVSMHVLHCPYWFSGILDYHYVFETGPLWLLILAVVTRRTTTMAVSAGRLLVPLWWLALLAVTVAGNHFQVVAGTSVPRIRQGILTVVKPGVRYQRFQEVLGATELQLPALILVRPSRADVVVEYVRNRPPFDADVLVGRYRPDLYAVSELEALFPGRSIYLFDPASESLSRLRGSAQPP